MERKDAHPQCLAGAQFLCSVCDDYAKEGGASKSRDSTRNPVLFIIYIHLYNKEEVSRGFICSEDRNKDMLLEEGDDSIMIIKLF